MIIGIVAIAKNFAIGRNGKLPWHYSSDLRFFKQTTLNNAVAMGFNTWKAIGKPLPKRLNIVLSRTNTLEHNSDVLLLRSKEQLVRLSEYLNCDLFIIGGAKTYENFSDVIEKWIVSEIPESIGDADTFMPADFLDRFSVAGSEELEDRVNVKFYEKRR